MSTVSMVTVGAMVVTSNLKFSDSYFNLDVGSVLVIGSALFWAIDNNVSKIITKRIDVLKISSTQVRHRGNYSTSSGICSKYSIFDTF